MSEVQSSAPAAYRTAVIAADILAPVGTVTCTLQSGGSASAGTYNVKVVAGNAFGRTTATTGNATIITTGGNLTGRAAFASDPGATFYDIYFSTDADPKWVGHITEAQRASGIVITAVGVTGAGGTAGAVDVQVPGTGGQSATTAAENTAYSIPANPIDCSGYRYCSFDIEASKSGDVAAISVTVIPFMYNTRLAQYQGLTPIALTFGGASGVLNSLTQRIQIEVRGNTQVALVVAKISGTGASLNIDSVLS